VISFHKVYPAKHHAKHPVQLLFACHIPCPSYCCPLDYSNNMRQGVQIMKFFMLQFSPSLYYIIPISPNVLSTLLPNTASLYSSLMWEAKFLIYREPCIGRIKDLYILIFMFLDSRWETKDSEFISPDLICS
jgi:hypothetical protein